MNIVALSAVDLVQVNFTQQYSGCLFCDYRNCSSTPLANHNFTNFSLTNVKFPDFPVFPVGGNPVKSTVYCKQSHLQHNYS